jgi:hypothetical protein
MPAVLLRVAPWAGLLIAGLFIWGLMGRLDAAALKLRSAERVIEQKEADARLSAELVARQQEAMRQLEANVAGHVERIYHVEVTRDCANSPAMRAATRGLRELFAAGEPNP